MDKLDERGMRAAVSALFFETDGDASLAAIAETAVRAYLAETDWRTIDTAPKGGTPFIAYSPTHGIRLNVSWGRFNRFDPDGYSDLISDWTHWRPSLVPPSRGRAPGAAEIGGKAS